MVNNLPITAETKQTHLKSKQKIQDNTYVIVFFGLCKL